MANDHEIRIRLETLNEIGQALSSTRDFDMFGKEGPGRIAPGPLSELMK